MHFEQRWDISGGGILITYIFSFHQKWSKLSTLLQADANDSEKKKTKILTVRLAIGPSFDSEFC
jgi:hypothetical protein